MNTGQLSRIENDYPDHVPGLSILHRIVKALDLQQKDVDGLFVAAGKLPPDVLDKLLNNPSLFTRVRRAATISRE